MTIEDRISLLIPAYLRGELSDIEREEIETLSAQNPAIAADIELQKNLKQALSDNESDFVPGDLGWARLSKAIDASQPTHVKTKPLPAYWRYAAIALAAVTVGQTGLLGSLMVNDTQDAQYMPVSETHAAPYTAKIEFAKDTFTHDVTAALRSVDGSIISGPSSLGLYQVKFESTAACQSASEKLQSEPVIASMISSCE